MRRTNAAGHDRTTRPELRCADLPVHALRLRRELPEGTLVRVPTRSLLPVQHGNASLGQHGSFVAHFDQAEALRTVRSSSLTGDIFSRRACMSRNVQRRPIALSRPSSAKGLCTIRVRLSAHRDQIRLVATPLWARMIMRQPPSGSRHRFSIAAWLSTPCRTVFPRRSDNA